MSEWIKLSIPHLGGKERDYVDKAVESTWITPLGPYVDEFEHRLEAYLGASDVVALSAGTAAIHLGLVLAGVKRDDVVICQSMTFAASANPIAYIGAESVFVDSEPDTWNMSPELLVQAIEGCIAKGRRLAAIVVVDLYGMPAKLGEICEIAERYSIPVVEDAAEAIGSEYRGIKCGNFGQFGTLSFNGNKMITTSGGGALVCHDKASAERAKFLSTQARENRPYYYHETIGYNYRLSNVSAAVGCAQMEVLGERVARRREICRMYEQLFADNKVVKVHCNPVDCNSNFWLSTIVLSDDSPISAEELRQQLADLKIETRRLWRPMHMQPVFANCEAYVNGVSEDLFNRGLCLPSSSTLTDDDVRKVALEINRLTAN